jgi:hypothetical protein
LGICPGATALVWPSLRRTHWCGNLPSNKSAWTWKEIVSKNFNGI